MVWSLFHYQKPSLDYDEKNYAAYKRVNQLYAQTLLKVRFFCFGSAAAGSAGVNHLWRFRQSITLQPNDLIWVHEYHTILVPTYVQAKIPRARIGTTLCRRRHIKASLYLCCLFSLQASIFTYRSLRRRSIASSHRLRARIYSTDSSHAGWWASKRACGQLSLAMQFVCWC